jgi:drug/metabolite transporter (DMT)-like permease
MVDQRRAYAYAISTVLLWSTVASAFKLTLRSIDYAQLLFYSSLASTVFLGLALVATKRVGSLRPMGSRECLRSAGLGLLNPFLYYAVLFKAYDLLPAQIAQPLNYTWAIALSLLAIPILRQKIRPKEIGAGLVSYAGVLVISTRGDVLSFRFADPLGVALALASTVIWALYWIANTMDRRDPVARLFLNFAFGLPFTLAYCALVSDLSIDAPAGLVGAAYVGVVEMGLAFVFWLTALRLSENTAKVGNLIFVSPFLSLVFIRMFVGEEILPATLAGLVLIVGGIVWQRAPFRRSEGTRTPDRASD